MPKLGISYGVLGGPGDFADCGQITTDDENNRNANYCYIDEFDDVTQTYRSGHFTSLANNPNSDYYGAYKVDNLLQPLSSATKLYIGKAY